MRIFLAGGTGAVGVPLIQQLVGAGHDVVATTRSPMKSARLRALGARPVVVDGLDAAAVGEAVATAAPDVIMHQMTSLAGMGDLKHFDRTFAATNRLRTVGTDNLLAAARAADVPRFIAQSFAGWPYERTGSRVKTETDPLDPNPPKQQRKSLAAIRHLEQAVIAAPLDGVVLRYGIFYGPGSSDEMVALMRRRRMPVVGSGDGIWSLIHLDDAAAAAVAALEQGSGIYNVVDDEPAPVRDVLTDLAEVLGSPAPRRIPVWLARLAAGEVVVSMTTQARGASNAKAKQELDWAPRWTTWRDGFRYGLGDTVATPTG